MSPTYPILASFFPCYTTTGTPHYWNTLAVMPIFRKKPPSSNPSNYRTIWIMDPIAKLYISCIKLLLTDYNKANHLGYKPGLDFGLNTGWRT